MKTVINGSGITAYAVEQTETAAELKASIRDLANRSDCPFEFRLNEQWETWARREVEGADSDKAPIEQSPQWYARQILRFLGVVRAEIKRGDAAMAAGMAMELSAVITECRMKLQWERPALAGLDLIQGRSAGGKKTAKQLKREAQAREARLTLAAQKLMDGNSRLSYTEVAALLSERGHGGAEAIRKKLPRLLQKNAIK